MEDDNAKEYRWETGYEKVRFVNKSFKKRFMQFGAYLRTDMGSHNRGQRWPHGGLRPGDDPEGQAKAAAGEIQRQNQAGNDASLLYRHGHVK